MEDQSMTLRYRTSVGISLCTGSVFVALALYDYMLRPFVASMDNGFVAHTVGPVGYELAQLLTIQIGYGAFFVPLLMFYHGFLSINTSVSANVKDGMRQFFTGLALVSLINLLLPIRQQAPLFTAGGNVGLYVDNFLFEYFDYTGTLLILLSVLVVLYHEILRRTIWHAFEQLQGVLADKKQAWAVKTEMSLQSKIESAIEKDRGKIAVPETEIQKDKMFRSSAEANNSEDKLPRDEKTPPILPKIVDPGVFVEESTKRIGQISSQRSGDKNSVKKLSQATKAKEPIAVLSGGTDHVLESECTDVIPSLDLLNQDRSSEKIKEDPKKLQILADAIETKLKDFGVTAKVMNILLGPIITRFEIQPAPGTKASKITGLSRDLARSLSVPSVRVVEVISGKTYIGLEIPNKNRVTVSLKTIFESDVFQMSQSSLCLALGVDISGDPVVVDLAKMPHLLVAGTTGSGKSVGLNTLLLSLLYKTRPEDLRLILIDPKMLEFAVYEGIPHLLTSVVTDMNDASYALNWCVNEMERRYKLMAELGVRNIKGYNEKVKKMPNIEITETSSLSGEVEYHEHLPYIVVIADEFADMMMMVGKKVEQLIARLAQKARAAGIHLILATQRPSVDVITGLIKANIPTRISFQVSSKIDSRTIIDQQGAESLLGFGDMLYLSPGSGQPVRCHGAYVSDEAVAGVVEHLRAYGNQDYIELNKPVESDSPQVDMIQLESKIGKDEALYDQIVDFVISSRKVSTSSVQRRFRIGYNRASVMVEKMEAEGVVSAMDMNGQRKVLSPKPVD